MDSAGTVSKTMTAAYYLNRASLTAVPSLNTAQSLPSANAASPAHSSAAPSPSLPAAHHKLLSHSELKLYRSSVGTQ